MRFLLLFVFCFAVDAQYIKTGLVTTGGNRYTKQIVGPLKDNQRNSTRRRTQRLGDKYGITLRDNEEIVTNENNFYRPCGTNNLACIREYLGQNSNCKPTDQSIGNLNLRQTTVFLIAANMTITSTEAVFSGLDQTEIRDFYVNTETGNVVLTIQVPALRVKSPRIFVTFRRVGKESIIRSDSAEGVFKCLIFTIVIPKVPKLRLEYAEIHPYVPNEDDSFDIGPNVFDSDDPDVVEARNYYFANRALLRQETFLIQSQLFSSIFVQKRLCDFHQKTYSL